jgi:hypothetical protein
MIIVFDTNVWMKELGLNSALGAATKLFIKSRNATVAIPEIVRLETEHNLRNELKNFISKIRNNHSKLLTVFGSLKEVVLPTDDDVDQKVAELLSSVDVEIIEIPFSLESARDSFFRTIDKVQPSDQKQEFKDGVLWADCVRLLEKDDVLFVTEDKAFYKGHNGNQGLADNLAKEAAKLDHTLKIFPSLSSLLPEVSAKVSIDVDALAAILIGQSQERINKMLSSNGFELGSRVREKVNLYATEKPTVLAFEFILEYECVDVTGEERSDAVLTLKGDGSYDTQSDTFNELRNFGETLNYKLQDGTEEKKQHHVIFAAGTMVGHKEIAHTVRYKLG